ncbi:hypothetical protein SUGI_0612140 [Cryptomeria japonica]|uniref:uncharacterized protein LOC131037414 n=1 Tax=Cryptomeria japonica TaxID=3369 RepID=UPI002414957C|nr:uncharacterized protein LOC131037414 [Cryptomeria japonica]GLJ30827.1 hypothetical protein SUGI_0612140 [Cryptomeria japonica]
MGSLEHQHGHDNDNGKNNGCNSFEFPKGSGGGGGSGDRSFHPRPVLGPLSKPAPSKWDDAQKWLVSLSAGGRGDHGYVKSKSKASRVPRNVSFRSLYGKTSVSKPSEPLFGNCSIPPPVDEEVGFNQDEGETKKIDCENEKTSERTDRPVADPVNEHTNVSYIPPASTVRSVSMRDMGTEMTPIASQEPSRTGTPLRATTPSIRSPVTSRPSTPGRSAAEIYEPGLTDHGKTRREIMALGAQLGKSNIIAWASKEEEEQDASKSLNTNGMQRVNINVYDARAAEWEQAERAEYMARYKREEVKIEAWENTQKMKAEAESGRIEVKVERMKCHAHKRLMKKLAKVRRKAEEKRLAAEAKAAKEAVKIAERANSIRQTGHIPSSFFTCKFISCNSSAMLYDCCP